MATKVLISRTFYLSVVMTALLANICIIQHVEAVGSLGRMSNHIFFRGRAPNSSQNDNNTPTTTTTTTTTTIKNNNNNNTGDRSNDDGADVPVQDRSKDDGADVPVQDKASLPAPSYPKNPNSFIDSLLNRDTIFDKNNKNTGKDNENNDEGNTNKDTTTTSTTTTTTTTTSTTTPKPTTTPRSTTTTTTTTTTTKPTTTTTTTTTTAAPRQDNEQGNDSSNRMFNEDGTVNKNRPTLLEFPTSAQQKNRDRQAQMQAADLILNQLFNRPSLLAGPVSDRSRDPGSGGSKLPFPPEEEPATVMIPVRIGAIVVNPDGSITFATGQSGSNSNQGDEDDENNNHESTTPSTDNGIDEKHKEGPSYNQFDVQDKPFYGAGGSMFDPRNDMDENGEESNEDHDEDDDDDESQEETTTYSVISKRSISKRDTSLNVQDRHLEFDGDNVDGDGVNVDDVSCYNSLQFSSCEYYSRCFSELEETCSTRDSYIGDDVSRFCSQTEETIETTESTLLSTYLKRMQQCVSFELSQILEGASCDDVTVTLGRSLLLRNNTSCLFLNGLFCDVIEDSKARPGLARMVMKPTEDPSFMIRLLLNIGDLTAYCRGSGSSIFVTDLMVLATTKDNPFTLPKPPIPGFAP